MLLLFFSRFFHFATDQWNFRTEGSQIESPFGRKNVLEFPWVVYGHNIVSLRGFWSKGGLGMWWGVGHGGGKFAGATDQMHLHFLRTNTVYNNYM